MELTTEGLTSKYPLLRIHSFMENLDDLIKIESHLVFLDDLDDLIKI